MPWDDAGELIAEGVDWVVDKHYDKIHDGATRNIHWTGNKLRKYRNQPTRYDKNGDPLPAEQQPQYQHSEPDSPRSKRSTSEYQRDPRNPYSGTDQYGQPENQYSSRLPSDQDRARDLAAQGHTGNEYPAYASTAGSVQPPTGFATTRGINTNMGDSGYGPADYGRDPRGSNGYDDGYEGGDADDYRRAYRPDRPHYDPSRYVPHAGAGVAAATAAPLYSPPPQGGQRYLPPSPATPRAYDDPYDDEYDSDDSYDRRRRARKSKSESGLRRYSSRGSSRRSERDRHGSEDGERGDGDGEEHKGPKHKMVATIGGALVGALAGYEISNRRGKPESFHTIAGAIVGAVGAREADKWYENRKEEKREHEKREREERDEEKQSRHDDRYQF